MTPERWQRLKPLFFEALDRPPEERAAFLDRACEGDAELRAELEALLEAEADAPPILAATPDDFAGLVGEAGAADPHIGGTIGPYRILREIGHGGMGTVYLAERDDKAFRRYVAMKVIRRGMDTAEVIGRFQMERQILAALNHPNIARLLDGGTTADGVSYFVMEYVEGRPITAYCDGQRLSIEERLALFQTVCAAIQYAHRNLVVHRDLKPSNILVTSDGTVKLLDFGIAKLLNPSLSPAEVVMTRTAFRMMTPEYASPEQVRGEPITTASDVYALGVLLYELLTGHRPYRLQSRAPEEIRRAICEEDPTRPSTVVGQVHEVFRQDGTTVTITPGTVSEARSTAADRLRRRLHGDLDNIILMAMRKEPHRRYASAEHLAEDIRRHLGGEPVLARKPTLGYRSAKFVRRHRFGLVATTAFLALLIGFGFLYTVQLRGERDRARQAAAQAEQVTEFMTSVFEGSNPYEALGDTITARALLERGVERIDTELSDQPVVQARLLGVMGNVYHHLGRLGLAEPLLRRALALRQQVWGDEHLEVAESLHDLAFLLRDQGEFDAAEPLFERALAMQRALLGEPHEQVAQTISNLATSYERKGDRDRAEVLYREALAMQRAVLGEEHVDVANTLNSLALLQWNRGDLEAAEANHRAALALFRKLLDEDHPSVASSLGNLALVQADRGNLAEAAALIRDELLPRSRRLLGPEHPSLAITLNNLASILKDMGDYAAAEPYQAEALDIWMKTLGDRNHYTAIGFYNLAELRRSQGDLEAADSLYRRSLSISRAALEDVHPLISHNLMGLAQIALARGQAARAEPLLREAIAIRKQAYVSGHPRIAHATSVLGACLAAQGRYEEAEPLLLEGYTGLVDQRGGEHAQTQDARRRLAALYEAWGKPEQAAQYQTE